MAETAKGNKLVKVKGYTKADGTKVHPHDRSTPDTSRGTQTGEEEALGPLKSTWGRSSNHSPAGPAGHRARSRDQRDRRHSEGDGEKTAPDLVALSGVGTDIASALLVAPGDNPERLRNEASFAHLCGTSPLDARSGKHQRHRLNRSGDRQTNSALWHMVITRMVSDPRTRHYIDRRMKEGLTKKEAVRCLKRYVAREVYNLLPHEQLALDSP